MLAQKYAEDGHEHDVQRRDEAGFSGGGGHQTNLLENGRQHEEGSAERADDPVAAVGGRGMRRLRAEPEQHRAQNQQRQAGDGRAQPDEGVGADVAARGALGGKRHAPEKRAQKQENRPFELCFHWNHPLYPIY